MDYGHSLRFGTFLTPSAEDPHRPVRLAQLSEELGYDIATFQDHPYQPRFLDTWTLLSYTAASTDRIGLAPNVLNVPMRPAPVTARAAASLDLLSGGRLSLALGAGGFWDAMEAMGARRLSPAQSVDALAEAIGLIRQMWDTSSREVVRGEEFYSVDGAKRGPAPGRRIPIHVGGYKPRMLRLIGRLADGWLPSLGYMRPGDLSAANARIDRAAADAGRDPADIERMLNVPIDIDQTTLIRLAREDGVSTFIVGSDDPEALRRFAGEVAPAVRAAVVEARGDEGSVAK